MNVYFDARMIDHPGIGRYIKCLLRHMLKEDDLNLYLLGDRNKLKKLLGVEENVIDFDYPVYSLREQFGFMKLKKIIGGDILHIPHYNIPVIAKFNLVVTIHDIIHILYPEGASGKLAPMYMQFMVKRILKSAKAVICVSQSTKDEIEKTFLRRQLKNSILTRICADNKCREKGDSPSARPTRKQQPCSGQFLFFPQVLHVIYEGVDNNFTKISDSVYLKSIRERYSLPDKFLLYVGSIRRHKNINTLLGVFDDFRRKNAGIKLVIVGKRGQDININREGVIYLGELAGDKELAAIYNLASCLFNLSLYEGFGLTILEAQRCGLPIVCSDIPVHREVGGKGALFVNPSYIDQIYENLYNVLFNNDIRKALISDGAENVKRFDWAVTAKKTLSLYRKAYDEGCDSSRLANGNAGRGKSPQCFMQNISSG